jgi:hypothetical protein
MVSTNTIRVLACSFEPVQNSVFVDVKDSTYTSGAHPLSQHMKRQKNLLFVGLQTVEDRPLPGGKPLLAGGTIVSLVGIAVDAYVSGAHFAMLRTVRVETS